MIERSEGYVAIHFWPGWKLRFIRDADDRIRIDVFRRIA